MEEGQDILAAADPSTPADELLALARVAVANDGPDEYEILTGLAGNPSTPTEVLDLIATLTDDLYTEVRSVAVAHPNTSPATIRRLFQETPDVDSILRYNLAVASRAEQMNVSPMLALLGIFHEFTDEQYTELRAAPDEWIRSMLPVERSDLGFEAN